MKRDIILAGVGGQGIISIAAIIGYAALAARSFSETIRSSRNEPARRRCFIEPQDLR